MNNLEKLKEINPTLYEKIKLKYITNAQSVKSIFDLFPLDKIEENFSKTTSLKEFNEILERNELFLQAHFYAREILANAQEKANKQLKEAEELLSKLRGY